MSHKLSRWVQAAAAEVEAEAEAEAEQSQQKPLREANAVYIHTCTVELIYRVVECTGTRMMMMMMMMMI